MGLVLGLLFFGYSTYLDRLTVNAVKAMSWSIANRVVVIDPGHGGIDPGAVGKSGTLEKDINLEVAKKLQVLLSQAGAAVVLTRESDVDLADSDTKGLLAKKRQDLGRRVAIANKRNAHIYLSIHSFSHPFSILHGPHQLKLDGFRQSPTGWLSLLVKGLCSAPSPRWKTIYMNT